MNKLIEELSYKAVELINWGIQDNQADCIDQFQSIFAELIVKECVDVVGNLVDQREPASTYTSKIKEHFGVE